MRWLRYMTHDAPSNGNFIFGGYSNNTVKRNVIQPLQELIGNDLVYHHSPNPHCTLWNRKIDVIGFGNISSVAMCQGAEYAGGLLDELTRFNKEGLAMLQTRFSIEGAKQFACLNPDNPYHYVKTDILDNPKRDIFKQHYTLDDNPHLPLDYVKDLKASYSGAFYQRYIKGLWVMADGAVFDFYEDKYPYVITDEQTPKAERYYIGCDYGIKNPMVFTLIGTRRAGQGELRAWVEREYYYDGRINDKTKTDSEYKDDCKAWIKECGLSANDITGAFIDPSAASFIAEWNKGFDMPMIMKTNNEVLSGIRTVSEMFKKNQFAVNKRCINGRKELVSYIWDEKAALRGEDKPLKTNDHFCDAIRYPLHSLYGGGFIDYEAMVRG